MHNWLLTAATIITTLAGAVKIHETFYPDLATRKRHLKRIVEWLLTAAAFGSQIWAIASVIKQPIPSTTVQLLGIVLKVSFSVSMLLFLIQIQCLDYFVGRFLELARGQLASTEQTIEILKSHEKAIVVLSASPALDSETQAALIKLRD